MGRGGTELALNIAFNKARNISGGMQDFQCAEGRGVISDLDITVC
jgi:hypothetical protein